MASARLTQRANAYFSAMAIREILEVPDPRLKTVSKPVESFDAALKALVADMFETMYAASGIGLAAIQIGEPLRLLVIDLQDRTRMPSPKYATPTAATSIPTSRSRTTRGCS